MRMENTYIYMSCLVQTDLRIIILVYSVDICGRAFEDPQFFILIICKCFTSSEDWSLLAHSLQPVQPTSCLCFERCGEEGVSVKMSHVWPV